MTNFSVYGNAKPKGSTRAFVSKSGKAITTGNNPNAKDWQNLVAQSAQQYKPAGGPYTEAVELECDFYFIRPKSVSVKKRPFHTVKPDLDKLVRNIGDALKGVIYAEDALIVKISASKAYDSIPRVEITVKEHFGRES